KILLVNGLGGGDDKEVEIGVGAPYTVRLNNPPGSPGADYAVFARIGRPSPIEAFPISLEAGDLCFLPQILDPLNAFLFTVAWNAPNPPAGVLDPTATPTPWISNTAGIGFPLVVSVQGVIIESGVLKCTNMVILNIF
ncbi:MAG: hypothetical protein ACI97A_003688, partial [Planctomycetota bacterium]